MSQTPAHHGKRVTWAELFFDLVFVFGVLQVTGLLAVHHQWWGVGRALVLLAPVYVTWVVATLQTNRRGEDRGRERVSLFAIGLCGLVMAVSLPHAYEDGGLLFAVAYLLSRVLIFLRYPPRAFTDVRRPFTSALIVSGPLIVLGAVLPDPWRETVWAMAAILDMAMAIIGRRWAPGLVYDGFHLAERFGLFVIIALGESIVDIGLPLSRQPTLVSPLELTALVVAFLVACGLWWTYFDAFNHSIARALVRPATNRTFTYHTLYGHFAVIASIVTIAVGFENAVTQPDEPLTVTHLSLLYVGTVVFLLSIAYVWWAVSRQVRGTRIGASAVLLLLMPLGLFLPAVVSVGVVGVVLFGLNHLERRWPKDLVARPVDEAAQP